MQTEKITFSFGENWKGLLKNISEEQIQNAISDITEWLGTDFVTGKSVLDIGSGSGIHSLGFYMLNASQIYSFDYDPASVEATKSVWTKAGKPPNWIVHQGSILDNNYIANLSSYDIVYSWGVLHHTGDLWNAILNAASLVKKDGYFWISIYTKGSLYPAHLSVKQKYNAASYFGKKLMVGKAIARKMLRRVKKFQNPFAWNQKKARGMTVYRDLVDWLGGLPYEVASESEMIEFGRKRGFTLERKKIKGEGACSIYLFRAK